MTDYGSFQLTSVADLPNAVVAFPGEHWSDGVAVGTVRAGAAVIPVASGARIGLREPIAADVTGAGAANGQGAIALFERLLEGLGFAVCERSPII